MVNTIRLHSIIPPGEPAVRVMPSYHLTNGHHDHDFYELVYVTEGYCLHNIDGLSTLLMEGNCFILPSGVGHSYSGNRVTRIYNCVFEKQMVPSKNSFLMILAKNPAKSQKVSFLRCPIN